MSPSPAYRALLAALLGLGLLAGASLSAQGILGQDQEGVETELAVAFSALDVEYDPHHSIYASEAQIFTGIYEGLFSYNPLTLDPVKSAAASFTKSRDSLTWTFYIRDEASWSDGSPLLARDFRDAWLRAIAPAEKADYASFFDVIAGARDYRLGKSQKPESVAITVIGDKILQVKLETPAPYFTRLLCHHSFSPIHPSMLSSHSWKASPALPVNGPYRIASATGGKLLLERNPSYWDAKAVAIPRIRIAFTDDDKAVTEAYNDGSIHWLAGPMELDSVLARQAINYAPMFGTQYWFFDCATAPWSRSEVRRALALLLPWKDIRSKDSYYSPAPTLVLPYTGYDKAVGIESSDEKAALKLLEDSGFPGGKGLPRLTILIPEGGDDAARVSEIMKKAWAVLPGLEVSVEKVGDSGYFRRMRQGPVKGGYTLGLTTWIGDFADPLAFLGMFTSDSNLNDPRLKDGEYDALLKAAASKDGEARLATLTEAENRLLSTAAVLPVSHSLAVSVIDTDYIQGWFINALDIHPFKYLAFGQRTIRPGVALR